MRALDTNVIVRYLVADEPRQVQLARRLIEHEPVWVGLTVLLETAWILESAYEFPPAGIADALDAFLGLPTVHVEAETAVARALGALHDGAPFADALHVATSLPHAERFCTFDRRLPRSCRGIGRVELLG
jgi:predicted nucleic acid-binding protein